MEILYVSVLCSKEKYDQLYGNSKMKPLQQDQKYHGTMVQGLVKNNVNLTAITSIPVTSIISSPKYYKKESEIADDVKFVYLSFFNMPIIRHICLFWGSFYNTILWCKKGKDRAIICDMLDISISSGAIFAAKLAGVRSVGILTDVPGYFADGSKKKKNIFMKGLSVAIQKINIGILHIFDSYVFLTEYMNTLVNTKKRNYVVIEGQVDVNMSNIPNDLKSKSKKKVCLYAGSLKRIYGIKMLVDAFLKADIADAELHIYGNGNFEEELIEICKTTDKVKYFGAVANEIIIQEQLKAILLINPRPSHEEYTKYSFPSKNMEYMVSGTPMLTTMLPGIPKEYNDYLYYIEDETIEGLCKTLKEVLSKPIIELHQKGKDAKEFVLKEKNNIIQAKKVLDLIDLISQGNAGVKSVDN